MRPKVLVVDDDPAVRGFALLTLRVHGYRIVGAAHGEEAVRAVFTERPDLVLLDLAMPVLDGYGVLERLRARGSTTPVVVTSRADLARAVVEEGRAAGYLAKPFTEGDLLAAVRAHLGGVTTGAGGR
jgi:DNA-binding response OmpR family regulator